MTTAELEQLLDLLRKRGVIGFEGFDIKVTFDLAAPVGNELLDPDKLVSDPDEDDGNEIFHSSPIQKRK